MAKKTTEEVKADKDSSVVGSCRKNHMIFFDALNTCPPEAITLIEGGRLNGYSNIKPQWRMQVMTEVFGPCGVGWWYTIDKEQTFTFPDGQLLLMMNISLYIATDDQDMGYVSKAIPGVGCSAIMVIEGRDDKKRLYLSEDANKCALTDALGVAMKALGVASDVYSGVQAEKQAEEDAKQAKFNEYLYKFKGALGEAGYAAIMEPFGRPSSFMSDPAARKTIFGALQGEVKRLKEEKAKVPDDTNGQAVLSGA